MVWFKRVRLAGNYLSSGIFRKTFLSMFTATSLLLLGLSVILIQTANRNAGSRNDQHMNDLALRMVQSFDNYVDTMRDTMSMLAQNPIINDIVEDRFDTNAGRYQAYSSFYSYASTLIRYKSYNQIYLVVPDLKRVVASNSEHYPIDAKQLSEHGWMERMDASELSFFYLRQFDSPTPLRDRLGFAIASPIGRLTGNYISRPAYLVMTTGMTNFRYSIQQRTVMADTFYMLIDGDGELMYSSRTNSQNDDLISSEPSLIRQQDGAAYPLNLRAGQESYRVYQTSSKNTKWRLMLFAPAGVVSESDRMLIQIVVIAMVASILIMGVVAAAISTGITYPIRVVTDAVREMSRENFDVRIQQFPPNELGTLGRAFNSMAERIETLIRRVYRAELIQRESQLYALQQQINPHFLYNTLEVINSLANESKTRQIKQVVQKLAGIFRYSIGMEDHGLAQIGREIQYVEDYLTIQQYRFPGMVEYMMRIDESLQIMRMPKFVIQPIVENALSHGKIAGQVIHIELRGAILDKRIVFTITDDGRGIDRDMLSGLNDRFRADLPAGIPVGGNDTEKSISIGLANVNARLRIIYGDAYGLSIDSEPGTGTCVVLTMPVEGEGFGKEEERLDGEPTENSYCR